ncbi:precorrin-3B synthase [Dietzia sp.]|uniref:precorrin-3B synthase n=1 Tax=Dietzia sp. TaxID=1871616 RepID=UPI002FD9E4EF
MNSTPSPTSAASASDDGDRCPGVLRLHEADDGLLARVRVPGGRLSPAAWQALAAAARLGDGRLHLTSRGNVQIRGLEAGDREELVEVLAAAELAPSESHDRARNILASPLAGRLPGHGLLDSLVTELHAAVLDRPALARLSGRFLFGLDDGSGDILRHGPDLGAQWTGAADDFEIVVAGSASGIRTARSSVPAVLADLAEHFLEVSGDAWRIAPGGEAERAIVDAAGTHRDTADLDRAEGGGASAGGGAPGPGGGPAAVEAPPVGWVDTTDGLVSLLAVTEFAVIDERLAEFLGAIDTETTISADRVIGVHGLREEQAEQVVRVLAPMGLIFDAASPWVRASACIGAEGCAKSERDVRADLRAAVAQGGPAPGSEADPPAEHWVGCGRACGWDHESVLRIATAEGYERREGPAGNKTNHGNRERGTR